VSQPKLLTFLKSHVPSVAAAWDAVKQRIKDQNNEIRKKKEAAKAAAEREAALLETAAKIDVSGDGGVIVQMISSPAAALDADDPLLSVQYPKLTPSSRVRVHYTGSLVDGKVFDSSERNPEPSEFTLGGGLIKCWNIGLPTLRVGDVAMLTCTSEYGYGSHGSPPRIPADATLKFRIRVVSVAPVEPSETERDSSVGADSEEL
jgi:FKBP-type peptidyl-prolyl cis-trans isomerase